MRLEGGDGLRSTTAVALLILMVIPGFLAFATAKTDRAAKPPAYSRIDGSYVLVYGPGSGDMSLLLYRDGKVSELWSAKLPGYILSMSLTDMNSDGRPEAIAHTTRSLGPEEHFWSLLIYENLSGQYQLTLNSSVDRATAPYISNRAHQIDCYGNGSECWVLVDHGILLVVHGHIYVTLKVIDN